MVYISNISYILPTNVFWSTLPSSFSFVHTNLFNSQWILLSYFLMHSLANILGFSKHTYTPCCKRKILECPSDPSISSYFLSYHYISFLHNGQVNWHLSYHLRLCYYDYFFMSSLQATTFETHIFLMAMFQHLTITIFYVYIKLHYHD
jgi:hypothetical protein